MKYVRDYLHNSSPLSILFEVSLATSFSSLEFVYKSAQELDSLLSQGIVKSAIIGVIADKSVILNSINIGNALAKVRNPLISNIQKMEFEAREFEDIPMEEDFQEELKSDSFPEYETKQQTSCKNPFESLGKLSKRAVVDSDSDESQIKLASQKTLQESLSKQPTLESWQGKTKREDKKKEKIAKKGGVLEGLLKGKYHKITKKGKGLEKSDTLPQESSEQESTQLQRSSTFEKEEFEKVEVGVKRKGDRNLEKVGKGPKLKKLTIYDSEEEDDSDDLNPIPEQVKKPPKKGKKKTKKKEEKREELAEIEEEPMSIQEMKEYMQAVQKKEKEERDQRQEEQPQKVKKIKKVKRTETHLNEKGYLVTQDVFVDEEYYEDLKLTPKKNQLPSKQQPQNQPLIKKNTKKQNQPKNQSSLFSFFGKPK